jgi:hypothetical protein
MKKLLPAFFLAVCLRSPADAPRLENPLFQPSTNVEIVWSAPDGELPRNLQIYKLNPQKFSVAVISNAMALASFQMKDLVSPPNYKAVICFQDNKDEFWTRALTIIPQFGQILYRVRAPSTNSADVPTNEEVAKRTWKYLSQFQIDPSELIEKSENRRIEFCGDNSTNVCARGIFLSRKVDGIEIRELGFGMDFGSGGQIKGFYLILPKLELFKKCQTASSDQIIAWVKEGKAYPTEDELSNRTKIKNLMSAKKLTLTKITPEYGEGKYGEMPSADSESYTTPFGILEGTANLGSTNVSFRLYCPILSTNAIKQ